MSLALYRQPHLLGLLELAKVCLHDDSPRMVLADWLDDLDEPERAEFIRLQCRLASRTTIPPGQRQQLTEQCRALLSRHGGSWLGSLWRWCPSGVTWHRGLLSLRLPRRFDAEAVRQMLPWIDTLVVDVAGHAALRQAVALLAGSGVNHVHLELRQALRESTLREALGSLPPSQALRTLAFDWPLGLLRLTSEDGESREPTISTDFLRWLLAECPAGRNLTHLGSSWPFNREQVQVLRQRGIQPVTARRRFWMHSVSPSRFRLPDDPFPANRRNNPCSDTAIPQAQ